jgi:DNA-binding HxlR family transcriptional regulator
LQARCAGVSPSVRSQRLRDLRDARLVEVDDAGWYAPTAMAKELAGPLSTLDEWTKRWAKHLGASPRRARS